MANVNFCSSCLSTPAIGLKVPLQISYTSWPTSAERLVGPHGLRHNHYNQLRKPSKRRSCLLAAQRPPVLYVRRCSSSQTAGGSDSPEGNLTAIQANACHRTTTVPRCWHCDASFPYPLQVIL